MQGFRNWGSNLIRNKFGTRHTIGNRTVVEDRKLAEGGFGIVFAAHDVDTGEEFALKKILCQDRERYSEAKQEAEMLAMIPSHPNLVGYIGHRVDTHSRSCKEILLLMEFCPDGHLLDLLDLHGGRLNEEAIVTVMRDLCRGLSHLHSLQPSVAHRDVKVENVLQCRGSFKLCDFGSCSTAHVDTRTCNREQLLRQQEDIERHTTLMYRAPEMVDLYKGFEVGPKVDVWMTGCVLYTLVFYRHPFQDQSSLAIANGNFTMPESSDVSKKLRDVIKWTLAVDPRNRPSAHQLAEIFDRWHAVSNIEIPQDAQKRGQGAAASGAHRPGSAQATTMKSGERGDKGKGHTNTTSRLPARPSLCHRLAETEAQAAIRASGGEAVLSTDLFANFPPAASSDDPAGNAPPSVTVDDAEGPHFPAPPSLGNSPAQPRFDLLASPKGGGEAPAVPLPVTAPPPGARGAGPSNVLPPAKDTESPTGGGTISVDRPLLEISPPAISAKPRETKSASPPKTSKRDEESEGGRGGVLLGPPGPATRGRVFSADKALLTMQTASEALLAATGHSEGDLRDIPKSAPDSLFTSLTGDSFSPVAFEPSPTAPPPTACPFPSSSSSSKAPPPFPTTQQRMQTDASSGQNVQVPAGTVVSTMHPPVTVNVSLPQEGVQASRLAPDVHTIGRSASATVEEGGRGVLAPPNVVRRAPASDFTAPVGRPNAGVFDPSAESPFGKPRPFLSEGGDRVQGGRTLLELQADFCRTESDDFGGDDFFSSAPAGDGVGSSAEGFAFASNPEGWPSDLDAPGNTGERHGQRLTSRDRHRHRHRKDQQQGVGAT